MLSKELVIPKEVRDICLASNYNASELFADGLIDTILIGHDGTHIAYELKHVTITHDPKIHKASIYEHDNRYCKGSLEFDGKRPAKLTSMDEETLTDFFTLLNISRSLFHVTDKVYRLKFGKGKMDVFDDIGELIRKYVSSPASDCLAAMSQMGEMRRNRIRRPDGALNTYVFDDNITKVPLLMESYSIEKDPYWYKKISDETLIKIDFKIQD